MDDVCVEFCKNGRECFNKWHRALFACVTCQRLKPYPKAAPTLSCLHAFFFLQFTELNIVIKAICEEEKSQLSGPKEENPAHLDNKPITDHRLVTAIELIGFFLQGVCPLMVFCLEQRSAAPSQHPHCLLFCCVCRCYATFSHLTASFIAICLEVKQTTIQPSPRADWNNHTQTLPPPPAAVTPQTDQWIHSSFFIFVLQLCHFKKTSNTLFSILVSELFTLLKHLLYSVIVAAVLAASRVATAKTEHEIHQTWTWCNPATGLVYFPLDSENSMYRCYCFTFIGL